jgi:hypothetical protein
LVIAGVPKLTVCATRGSAEITSVAVVVPA